MSDRPAHRGGGRGGGGGGGFRGGGRGGHGGGRGGGDRGDRGGHHGGAGGQDRERPKKENILDLAKYMDKQITVKFNGGRQVQGTLKGYDALMNLVLDDVQEIMRDDEGNESTRSLGLVVARGTLLVLVSPVDGSEEIANPFVQAEDD
jgi:U6 snRNA-associated Sm-like protein LSm7